MILDIQFAEIQRVENPETALELKELKAEHEQLETEFADLQTENNSLLSSNAELTANNETLQNDKTELEKSNAELTVNNKALQNENKNLSEKAEGLENQVEALQGENATLETRVEELEASIKPEQEKAVTITENGTTEVLPDENKTLSKVTVNVDVPSKDNPLQYATFADGSIFKSARFPENYKIEFGFAAVNNSSAQRSFLSSNITEITITTPLGKYLLSFCQGCEKLKVVTFTNGSGILEGNWNSAFYGCKELETINGEIDFSNVTTLNNILHSCYKLKDITIKPNSLKLSFSIPSPVLSNESIQSIIDGLATVETQQTLTLHSDVYAKITDEQYNSATQKGWVIA